MTPVAKGKWPRIYNPKVAQSIRLVIGGVQYVSVPLQPGQFWQEWVDHDNNYGIERDGVVLVLDPEIMRDFFEIIYTEEAWY